MGSRLGRGFRHRARWCHAVMLSPVEWVSRLLMRMSQVRTSGKQISGGRAFQAEGTAEQSPGGGGVTGIFTGHQ